VARDALPKPRSKPGSKAISKSSAKSSGGSRKPRPPVELGDVAFVYGKDEHGVHVLRRRSPDAPVEAGVLQPLVEGKPITEEVISLRARPDAPMLFDVSTVLDGPPGRAPAEGPSQVATESYRKGWETIWGGRRRAGNRDLN
jgi:hypothetical protein